MKLGLESSWKIVIIAGCLLAVAAGYAEGGKMPPVGGYTDFFLYGSLVVVMAFFAVGTVHLARRNELRRPTWNRSPLDWSNDPLQALFATTCWMGSMAGGALMLTLSAGNVRSSAFWIFGSVAAGLVVGQVIAYRLFRHRLSREARS
jgi:hypothetical protein